MKEQHRHLDALTGIRGIAAWGVVLFHIRLSLVNILPSPAIAALGKGYLAVDLFFILSGFVIWYNYAERIRSGGLAEARLFLWRRFARIWPLHATILSAFIAFAALLAVTGHKAEGYPWAELPLHILLVQNWGLTKALTWNDPAWSISTETAAYLVFPALVAVLSRLAGSRVLLSGLAMLIALAIHSAFAANGFAVLSADVPGMGIWRCLGEFSMGALMCLLWKGLATKRKGAAIALAASGAWALAGWLLGLPETAVVPALLFLSLLALALDRGPVSQLLGSPVLRYLGEISYSTYLAHFLLFILFKLAFVGSSLQLGLTGLAGFLALVLAASVTLYHGVEKPAQRWLNRHPPRGLLRPASVPAE